MENELRLKQELQALQAIEAATTHKVVKVSQYEIEGKNRIDIDSITGVDPYEIMPQLDNHISLFNNRKYINSESFLNHLDQEKPEIFMTIIRSYVDASIDNQIQ